MSRRRGFGVDVLGNEWLLGIEKGVTAYMSWTAICWAGANVFVEWWMVLGRGSLDGGGWGWKANLKSGRVGVKVVEESGMRTT
jgi:hypothetical protein